MAEHYFTKKPISKAVTTSVSFSFQGFSLTFLCVRGTFSSKKVDVATKLLLQYAKMVNGWDVLDLGCGIGVIGISVKKAYPSCIVTMSDINERALQFSEKNAKKNDVTVTIIASDLFSALDYEYDSILSNPPHHVGRAVVFYLIEESLKHLKHGGYLQLVARHTKGGKMIQQKMETIFGNCAILVKQGGLRVYCSKRC